MKDAFLTSTRAMIDRIIDLFICKTNRVVEILFLVVEQFIVASIFTKFLFILYTTKWELS